VQLDRNGLHVLAEVTGYDPRTARHEVKWLHDSGSHTGRHYKASLDFCTHLVYSVCPGTASRNVVRE
jgi:hypothetical protein